MIEPWTKSRIIRLLQNEDRAVLRALIVVYQNQTAQEKNNGSTIEDNGVGFTGIDADILTSFVRFYESVGFLTNRQIAITRNKIVKYWRQLLISAELNGHSVNYSRKA